MKKGDLVDVYETGRRKLTVNMPAVFIEETPASFFCTDIHEYPRRFSKEHFWIEPFTGHRCCECVHVMRDHCSLSERPTKEYDQTSTCANFERKE